MAIRRASAQDSQVLTALCLRSKAYWGYDDAFMAGIAGMLAVEGRYIQEWPVYVMEEAGKALGFYGFHGNGGRIFLNDLFVEPDRIGSGVGRTLWNHAVETAKSRGWHDFYIESDPFAEPFYHRMGARGIGTIRSESGRDLPLLVFTVTI